MGITVSKRMMQVKYSFLCGCNGLARNKSKVMCWLRYVFSALLVFSFKYNNKELYSRVRYRVVV